MKPFFTLIIATTILLTGCIASIHPYTKPIKFEGDFKGTKNYSEIILLQAHDVNHLQSKDIINILQSENPHPQKKTISPSPDGTFDITLEPFGRNDVLWIIPPLWTLLVDHSSNVVIKFQNKEIYGISINNKMMKLFSISNEGTLKETTEQNVPFIATIRDEEIVSIKIRER